MLAAVLLLNKACYEWKVAMGPSERVEGMPVFLHECMFMHVFFMAIVLYSYNIGMYQTCLVLFFPVSLVYHVCIHICMCVMHIPSFNYI
jgi:hypothetical protein